MAWTGQEGADYLPLLYFRAKRVGAGRPAVPALSPGDIISGDYLVQHMTHLYDEKRPMTTAG